jgi:2-polyprenyl-6-methoxyphenol hydroxylase-like FAD-dependent oxidoreductase
MNVDVIIVGGGIAGSTLATALTRAGKKVLVLERETKFKDRVRGENILPWGVSVARRLGVVDALVAAGGHFAPFFDMYVMGEQTDHRPMKETTPHGECSLNMYHPDLQEALLAGATRAGVTVKRGASVRGIAEKDGRWTVRYAEGEKTEETSITARVVVGADGRFSKMREWGGFTVNRDPDFLRIAGALVHNTSVPESGAQLCMGPEARLSFIAPLGNKRARMYFVYIGAMGDRKLSGKEKIPEFLDAMRSTCAPASWFEGVEVVGPLAEFEGADQSVPSPAKPGLALIGDAAAATDPSWGCGLSKTMVDVETLSKHLLQTDDWDLALKRYAADHDAYYEKLHGILGFMAELFWSGGPEGDARRARVLPLMKSNPMEFPDSIGLGPFGPSAEQARKALGET